MPVNWVVPAKTASMTAPLFTPAVMGRCVPGASNEQSSPMSEKLTFPMRLTRLGIDFPSNKVLLSPSSNT